MKNKNMYFVTMTDAFLSGWGEAEGKTNKLVFVCMDYEQAKIVSDNAKARTDMKRVNICTNYPYHLFNNDRYYTQEKIRDEYPNFYEKDFFKKQKYYFKGGN